MNTILSVVSGFILCCLVAYPAVLGHGSDYDLWWTQKYQRRLQSMQKAETQDDSLRLPGDVLPMSYTLLLVPFIEEDNFTIGGRVQIIVECNETTFTIMLHSVDIDIEVDSVKVGEIGTGNSMSVMGIDLLPERDMIAIRLDTRSPLVKGNYYLITIDKFVAQLSDLLAGFYRSTYEENGVTKYLAVTQMEPLDARRAFPCFDEPNMKATFAISIGRRQDMSAISNMPLIRSQTNPPGYSAWLPSDYVMDTFEATPKMSTYLVAMIVSEFVGVPSQSGVSKANFTIWARPGYQDKTKYAGEIGPKVLDYFERYFGIDFPLPKQDMAAIPDFSAGAMENWGLITYREVDLLFDEQRSSRAAKQRVAEVVTHELSHQWFGNLVTIDWWSIIWLNEGFASYMEHIGMDIIEPTFQMKDQFVVATLHPVFGIDSLESTRPINMQVNTSAQINAMFDSISYDKGASIIRMCAGFVGVETFRKGVVNYLNQQSYSNAVQDDLWDAIEAQVRFDRVFLPASVKEIMESWTEQPGYPLITLTRDYSRDLRNTVSQKRFLLQTSETTPPVNRWWVPVTYTYDFGAENIPKWMSVTENEKDIGRLGVNNDQWVILNVGQVGYYRVAYDEKNFLLIVSQLLSNHTVIPSVNRAQLLDDSLNIARAGSIPYSWALELTKYLVHEREYVSWSAASRALDFVQTMFYGQADEAAWKNYVGSLVSKLYDHVGFNEIPEDAHLSVLLRSHAINWACVQLGLEDCVNRSKEAYNAWMGNPENVLPPNLLRLISCSAVASGDQQEWNFAYEAYKKSTVPSEKNDLLRAITCTKIDSIIDVMLNQLMLSSTAGIRLQDLFTFFSNIAANPAAHEKAIDFLIARWDDIKAFLNGYTGIGAGSMNNLFVAVCNGVNTEEKLQKLTRLLNDHPDDLGNSKSVQQGYEVAKSNINWVEKNYGDIVKWLKDNEGSSTTTETKTTTAEPATQPTGSANTIRNSAAIVAITILWGILN